jgi:hypothetical protein
VSPTPCQVKAHAWFVAAPLPLAQVAGGQVGVDWAAVERKEARPTPWSRPAPAATRDTLAAPPLG